MDANEQNALEALRAAAGGAPVCLGHDWLTGMRGGERVLEYFCRAFPEAPIAAIVGDPALVSSDIASHRLLLSPVGHLPGAVRLSHARRCARRGFTSAALARDVPKYSS